MNFTLKNCTEKQVAEILEILNDAILHSTALYDYKPKTLEIIQTWYETKINSNLPILGIFNESGSLLGFGSYGTFRNWPAYKYTVEHSIYVKVGHRGKGLGKILLQELIKYASEQDYHVLIGGIDSTNQASIKLHEDLGFLYAGTIKQAGYKFNRWLDLSFYQLILQTPKVPTEN